MAFSARNRLAALALLGLATLPHSAQGQTLIYDNGPMAPTSAFDVSSDASADDFVFSSTQTFDRARVWLLDYTGLDSGLEAFSGTLSWLVRSNNGGIPGSVLFSGTVSGAAITLTDSGVDYPFGQRIFQLDFPLSSTTLSAGTYWFSIKENGLSDPEDGTWVYWLDAGSSTGFETRADFNEVNPTTWSYYSAPENRAFQLFSSAAPEPGTLALLALGMVGGVIARRRE